MESLADMVARLLRESRAAHERALTAREQHRTDAAHIELTLARGLRVEAHDADPNHTVPAWASERPPHAAMMEFYSHKLGA